MNDEQKRMVEKLARCTFQPGSHPKRFVGEMFARTRMTPDEPLTARQDWYLCRLYYSYRGQIGHHNPKPADFDSPPPPTPKSKPATELEVREANGEIIVCRAPSISTEAANELERLKAWNEGRAR